MSVQTVRSKFWARFLWCTAFRDMCNYRAHTKLKSKNIVLAQNKFLKYRKDVYRTYAPPGCHGGEKIFCFAVVKYLKARLLSTEQLNQFSITNFQILVLLLHAQRTTKTSITNCGTEVSVANSFSTCCATQIWNEQYCLLSNIHWTRDLKRSFLWHGIDPNYSIDKSRLMDSNDNWLLTASFEFCRISNNICRFLQKFHRLGTGQPEKHLEYIEDP